MNGAPPQAQTQPTEKVGVIRGLRGLMVEVEILGARPEEKELLAVEGYPQIFLEVSFFKANAAVCVNLTNSQELRCGQTIRRSGRKVTVPVGPFYRFDPSRNQETGGVGLGLAIVKACIESCQGRVRCRNRRPAGLEVEIELAEAPSADFVKEA